VTFCKKGPTVGGWFGLPLSEASRGEIQSRLLVCSSFLDSFPRCWRRKRSIRNGPYPSLQALPAFSPTSRAARRGKVADTQCALNVHSLTRSHKDMLKSKTVGGHSRRLRDLLRPVPGRRFRAVLQRVMFTASTIRTRHVPFAGQKVKITGTQRAVTCCYTSLESMNMRSCALLEASDGA
jgi:hypothetical protein